MASRIGEDISPETYRELRAAFRAAFDPPDAMAPMPPSHSGVGSKARALSPPPQSVGSEGAESQPIMEGLADLNKGGEKILPAIQGLAMKSKPQPTASVATGSTEGPAVSAISKRPAGGMPVIKEPDGYFQCGLCWQLKPNADKRMRGNVAICIADQNSYGSLSHRWKSQKSLKPWWTSKTKEEQAQWYKEQQSHQGGTKRNFDQISHEESSGSMTETAKRAILNHIPLTVFIREQFMMGVDKFQAQLEFARIVEHQTADCIYENGEWHVPSYGGIQSTVGQVDQAGYKTSRRRDNIEDANEASALANDGDKLVKASTAASSRSSGNNNNYNNYYLKPIPSPPTPHP